MPPNIWKIIENNKFKRDFFQFFLDIQLYNKYILLEMGQNGIKWETL
jgi:hypothetical protein